MKRCGVYKIENTTKGLVYIGSSTNIKKRINDHKRALEKGSHDCRELQKDYDNGDNIEYSVIKTVPNKTTRKELLMLESFYILKYDSLLCGYNKAMPASIDSVIENYGDELRTEARKRQAPKKEPHKMLESKKYCQVCGTLISDLDDPKTDYFRHIRLKYCPTCRGTMEHLQGVARVQEYRRRKRARDHERDTQLDLLKEENELLRQRVAQLRQSVDAPEELHSAHSSGARWFDR